MSKKPKNNRNFIGRFVMFFSLGLGLEGYTMTVSFILFVSKVFKVVGKEH